MKKVTFLFLTITFFTSFTFSQDSIFIKKELSFLNLATDYKGKQYRVTAHSIPVSHLTYNEKNLQIKLPDRTDLNLIDIPYSLISEIRLQEKGNKRFHVNKQLRKSIVSYQQDQKRYGYLHSFDYDQIYLLKGLNELMEIPMDEINYIGLARSEADVVLGTAIGAGIGMLAGLLIGEKEKSYYYTVTCPKPSWFQLFPQRPCIPGTYRKVEKSKKPVTAALLGMAGGAIGWFFTKHSIKVIFSKKREREHLEKQLRKYALLY